MGHPAKPALHAVAATLALALGLAGTPARAGEVTFGGKVFADFGHLQQTDDLARTTASNTNGDVKRFYLDADYRADAAWSMHLTTDINWLRRQPVSKLWVRQFYVQRTFGDGTVVQAGVRDMPMQALTNQWYGYRYIDAAGVTLAGIDTSADWGAHLNTRVAPDLDLAVSVVSGGGYKQPQTGRRADVEAVASWTPIPQVLLAVGGYDGQLGANGSAARPLRHTARRFDLMAAYAGGRWRVGTRWSYASNWNDLYAIGSGRASNWSSWASRTLAARWSVFARFDLTRPTRLTDPARRSHYANVGLEWRPDPKLRLALVAKHTATQRDGTVLRSGNEAGVWGEWSF